MDFPTTIIGVIGASITLIYVVLKAIFISQEREKKEKEDREKKIAEITNATDIIRMSIRMHNN